MGEKIPHYVNDPVINQMTAPENKLYRPQINFRKAAVTAVLVIILAAVASAVILFVLSKANLFDIENNGLLAAFFSVYWKTKLVVLLLTLKYILIWLIRVYQRYAKSETRLRCCYTPSCSEYAILALQKYGLIVGVIKAVDRLLRCGPPGGIDYP